MDVALESHWIAWTDPYNALGIWAKVFLGIYVTLCVTVGTVLHLGMISYERYGQDPQKRSLNSQVNIFQLRTESILEISRIIFSLACGILLLGAYKNLLSDPDCDNLANNHWTSKQSHLLDLVFLSRCSILHPHPHRL